MTTPCHKKMHDWNDPKQIPDGIEKRDAIIGAVAYPSLCIICLGVAHFVFGELIVFDTNGLILLVLSPLLGGLFFFCGSYLIRRMI